MWYDESVFYQIYPLGFCGAPEQNDGVLTDRIHKLIDWIPEIKKTGADAVYLCPLFESDAHGYDTRDYKKLDCRLGSNEALCEVVNACHQNGIRVVFDGVFNHVGRGFWAFEDVKARKWDSPYKDWFNLSFDGNSPYNDGFWYEGWEGHYDLVKLNLYNPAVRAYLLECVGYWMDVFGIDGIRLDVAYMVNRDFMKELRRYCDSKRNDFFLVGEMLHGDYNQLTTPELLHSVTNYECYKGLYSSFNSMNMFEIGFSLNRQFGPENWTLYKGKHLLNFVDNHDVSRIASILTDKNHLAPIFGLLFGMPGIPCVYYGSEWGEPGEKRNGDRSLRPMFENAKPNGLTDLIAKYAAAHKALKPLVYGGYRQVMITNKQLIFVRECDGKRVYVSVNAEDQPFTASFQAGDVTVKGVIFGETVEHFGQNTLLAPCSVEYWEEI